MNMFSPLTSPLPTHEITVTIASIDDGDFGDALDRVKATKAEMNRFNDETMKTAEAALMAVRDQWPANHDFHKDTAAREVLNAAHAIYEPFERRWDELVDAHFDACEALLLIPAPTAQALAEKMKVMFEHQAWNWNNGEELMAVIAADIERVINEGRRSPIAFAEVIDPVRRVH